MDEVKEFILDLCKQQNLSLRQLAIKAGLTPQNLSNKFARGSFYLSDIEAIAKALDKELVLQFKDK